MDKEELKQNYASIHTLRMEGDCAAEMLAALRAEISIHTLRVEGDPAAIVRSVRALYFNPHPPHGG